MSPTLGASISALAANTTGWIFAINEVSATEWQLIRYNGFVTTMVGTLTDVAIPSFNYDITALDYSPADLSLYGVATVVDTDPANDPAGPDPTGPYLVSVNATNAKVTQLPLILGVGRIDSIAVAPDGTMYGVDGATNRLYQILYRAGDIPVPDPGEDPLPLGSTVELGIVPQDLAGIDFIGDTLYGLTSQKIYTISTVDATATDIGDSNGGVSPTGLVYDATRPGYLLTVTSFVGNERLWGVPLGATLTMADIDDGAPTVVSALTNVGDGTLTYGNIQGMDFNSVNGLYAVGEAIDLDSYSLSGTRSLLGILPMTGQVFPRADIAGNQALTSIAFRSDDTLFAVGTDQMLYTLDIVTGALTAVGDLGLDVVGIDFVDLTDIGLGEVLYGVTDDSVYAINTADASTVLMGASGRLWPPSPAPPTTTWPCCGPPATLTDTA